LTDHIEHPSFSFVQYLEQQMRDYLSLPDGVERMKELDARLEAPLKELAAEVAALIQCVKDSPPSRGYEPMLIECGFDPILARMRARLLVHWGRRCAAESGWHRPVVDAIRFLAERDRQRRAVSTRAELLLKAWHETSIIETLCSQAGVSESEFIALLRAIVDGSDYDRVRIREIAASVAPHLSIPRGPKISAPSASHEFYLSESPNLKPARRPNSGDRAREYADAVTQATRLEFDAPEFDYRPARRRIRRNGRSCICGAAMIWRRKLNDEISCRIRKLLSATKRKQSFRGNFTAVNIIKACAQIFDCSFHA
jgi:hypothetical protein